MTINENSSKSDMAFWLCDCPWSLVRPRDYHYLTALSHKFLKYLICNLVNEYYCLYFGKENQEYDKFFNSNRVHFASEQFQTFSE